MYFNFAASPRLITASLRRKYVIPDIVWSLLESDWIRSVDEWNLKWIERLRNLYDLDFLDFILNV
jgi:hypothetical protein